MVDLVPSVFAPNGLILLHISPSRKGQSPLRVHCTLQIVQACVQICANRMDERFLEAISAMIQAKTTFNYSLSPGPALVGTIRKDCNKLSTRPRNPAIVDDAAGVSSFAFQYPSAV